SFTNKKAFWLSFSFLLCLFLMSFTAFGQSKDVKPLMQTYEIQTGQERPRTSPTPLVKKIGSSQMTSPINSASISRRTSIPALAEVSIPGYSGVLVESEGGNIVMESYSDQTFNPASNVKVATSYAVLKTFGPNFRFATQVWTDGFIDKETGTLTGNLYVSGRDPIFNYEHAVTIANELNRLSIRKVEGDVIVTDNFIMNYSNSSVGSGNSLFKTINASTRSTAANTAWLKYLTNNIGKYNQVDNIPSVFVTGSLYVQGLPTNVKLLFTHESTPLREIVKVTMSYSNNFLAEKLGDMLGGAYAVARVVQMNTGSNPDEFSIQTCSGLGINRVTPQAQMRLLKAFRKLLKENKMTFSDVMPVAGLDDGTLRRRFNDGFYLGSVVGKTGTLGRTDSGVSTLSGEITTRQGKFLFVIFNQRGSVGSFRNFQNFFVPLLQNELGGAIRMTYTPVSMDKRLAKSRVKYPGNSGNKPEDD
ncbi:MAG: D-alanyl-D-alanine carboxypeptidase, partial [Aridibacter sp.]